jgi:hydrogenase nickel insertion protein HypA
MHELMITEDLIRMILEANQDHELDTQNSKIVEVVCELGKLTTYKQEPILFYYDILKKNTNFLKDSILKVNVIKGKILCNKCKRESEIDEPFELFCSKCDSDDVKIIQGQDFRLIEFKRE